MTPTVHIPSLRELAEKATRIVAETDHTYREVGKIVAVDVERVEVSPDVVLRLLDRLALLEKVAAAAEGENLNAIIPDEYPDYYLVRRTDFQAFRTALEESHAD